MGDEEEDEGGDEGEGEEEDEGDVGEEAEEDRKGVSFLTNRKEMCDVTLPW